MSESRHCFVCKATLPYNRSHLGTCPDAPLLCVTCRAFPDRVEVARQFMDLHLSEHRERGDFRHLYKSSWIDPGNPVNPSNLFA